MMQMKPSMRLLCVALLWTISDSVTHHPICDATADNNRVLITDLMFPSSMAKWRAATIQGFIVELDADILVANRAASFAGVEIPFEWPSPANAFRRLEYDVLIFNPAYNHLNVHNDDFDGTAFNGQRDIDYVLRLRKFRHQAWDPCQYGSVFHIFAVAYWRFNNVFAFPPRRQVVHVVPGGGIYADTPPMRGFKLNSVMRFACGVHLIHTDRFLADALGERTCNPSLFVPGFPLLYKGEQLVPRPPSRSRPLGVAVTCMGDLGYKGVPAFLRLADLYRQRFPHDNVVFMTIGNPPAHPGVVGYPSLAQADLDRLYAEQVDVFVNFEPNEYTTGPNGGWPLGREAMTQGVVIISTDRANCNEGNGYNFNGSVHVLSNDTDVEAAMAIIKRYHDDRALLEEDSRQAQADFHRAFSYDRVQGRILEYVRQVMNQPRGLPTGVSVER